MGIRIITDSTSYINKEFVERYNIKVISLNVTIDGKSYREQDLDNSTFYDIIDKNADIPKSSQPSMDEALNAFESAAKAGDDIVGIFLSSDMSGTYSTANLIKDMVLKDYPDAKIAIVDSKTNCMELGFQALQAARAAEKGKTIEEIIKICEVTKKNSRFLFIPETLKYLKKGGRIGNAAALLGSIFQIKPILTVEDGKTTVFDKVRTTKKAVSVMIEKVITDTKDKKIGEIVVHHINCREKAIELSNILKDKFNIKIEIQDIGPVIGLHVGPGCVGIAYYTND